MNWTETETGLLVPAHALEDDSDGEGEAASAPTAMAGCDLFAGAGGFSCGMHGAGIDVVAAVEWDEWAAITYLVNLGRPDCRVVFDGPEAEARWQKAHRQKLTRTGRKVGITPAEMPGLTGADSWIGSGYRRTSDMPGGCRGLFLGDAKKVTGAQLLDLGQVDRFDVVFGGPPCQGLSKANAKACVADPRNALLWEFLRIVEELRPRAFVIENVPQLLSAGKGGLYRALEQRAVDAGYDVAANVLDAVNYGVPQYRRRAIVLGHLASVNRGRPIQFPVPTHWPWGRPADGEPWRIGGERDASMRAGVKFDEDAGTFVEVEVPEEEALPLFDGGAATRRARS